MGSIGGHTSWANTQNRQARMAVPQQASPASWEWHADRFDPNHELPAEERRQRGESAKRAYMKQLSRKALRARRLKKADRLVAEAGRLREEASRDGDVA
ncbi:hypothetical protein H5T25_18555 [Mycobacterium malmoense]|nr:hypothetical protein H5T25_18555 [Mycobacterium malmoense]